jgi:hypothetical protein
MKERPGYTWVECGNSGYWSKVQEKPKHSHKLDFYCPHCSKVTGTYDDVFLLTLGICAHCYVMHIEGRKHPEIDVLSPQVDISETDITVRDNVFELKNANFS